MDQELHANFIDVVGDLNLVEVRGARDQESELAPSGLERQSFGDIVDGIGGE
jgi:hypothetical protein